MEFDSSGPVLVMETTATTDLREEVCATPSRGYSQQPASVETAVPAWVSSPQRYRAPLGAPQQMVPLSPARLEPLSSPPGSISSKVPMLPAGLPQGDLVMSWGSMQVPEPAERFLQERVQVPRQVVRSPDLMVRDNGMNGSAVQLPSSIAPMEVRRATSPMPSMVETFVREMPPQLVETVVREPVPAQITVVEKVVEQQGMSAHEMQVWLQGERSRISGAMQEIMAQHSKTLAEVINEEVHKVIHMVNAVSNSCEERLVRLEADRSARSTVFQGLKRDVDGLQAQIADLEQFRTIGSSAKDQAGQEREEVMAALETVTKDIQNQHRSVLSGLAVQKELQQKLETAMAEVRRDIEALAGEASNQRGALAGLSSQQELHILQRDQQTIDKAIVELRRQTTQSLEIVRTEFATEVSTLRQTHIGGLSERLVVLEQRRVDQDLQELTRLIHTERSGRNDLAQTLESYRTTHLQTCTELRGEIDSWSEKLSRLEMAVVEERGARERAMLLEQNLNEVRNGVNRRFGDIEAKLDASAYVSKDVQELKKLVSIEQSERSDLAQSFDSQRKSNQQMVDNLRAEIERSLQEVRKVAAVTPEDKSAREQCGQLEKASTDLRTTMNRRLIELTSRLDIMEGSGMVTKELEEITRQIRAENTARVDISQTLDAYRMAHLQTSTELRADLDVALEKLSKLESASMHVDKLSFRAAVRAEDRPVTIFGTSTPSMLKPQGNALLQPQRQTRQVLSPGLASTTFVATEGITSATDGSMRESATLTTGVLYEEDSRLSLLSKGLGTASVTDIAVVREEIRSEDNVGLLGNVGQPLFFEDSTGGGLLGRGLSSAAAMNVAADVAEVLADDRRLLGRGMRAAGSLRAEAGS